MRCIAITIALAACSAPAQEQPASQPPETTVPALRLGHFSNKERTVGVVIEQRDRSARIKLDGDPTVHELDANRLAERTDYFAGAHRVMLQIFDDGRTVVFVEGAPNGVEVVRDGDVDPVAGTTIVKAPAACCKDTPKVSKDQPPETKLKLGHYTNDKRGIGATIDRTQHAAKIRFDGSKDTQSLDPTPADGGRTDYIRSANHVVLQVWDDGRVVVFVDGVRDGIALRRDGDADPL